MTVPRPVPAQALPHRAEITSSGALWRSTVFPGWGQRYKGEKKKGWILTGTAVGLLAATVGAVINEQRAHSSYERLTTTNRADYDAAYSRELQAQLVADLAGGATLLLWGGNIADSAFTPIEQIRVKDAKIQDVLPAMQKFYETNPVLSIVLENRSSEPVSKVKVRFEAKDIMDLPAESETVESIPGGIA